MGRPKKSRDEKISTPLPLRMKESEARVIRELAEVSGQDVSKYVRNLVLRTLGVVKVEPKHTA